MPPPAEDISLALAIVLAIAITATIFCTRHLVCPSRTQKRSDIPPLGSLVPQLSGIGTDCPPNTSPSAPTSSNVDLVPKWKVDRCLLPLPATLGKLLAQKWASDATGPAPYSPMPGTTPERNSMVGHTIRHKADTPLTTVDDGATTAEVVGDIRSILQFGALRPSAARRIAWLSVASGEGVRMSLWEGMLGLKAQERGPTDAPAAQPSDSAPAAAQQANASAAATAAAAARKATHAYSHLDAEVVRLVAILYRRSVRDALASQAAEATSAAAALAKREGSATPLAVGAGGGGVLITSGASGTGLAIEMTVAQLSPRTHAKSGSIASRDSEDVLLVDEITAALLVSDDEGGGGGGDGGGGNFTQRMAGVAWQGKPALTPTPLQTAYTPAKKDLLAFDVQRCKFLQYRSGEGASRLTTVLRAWVIRHPNLQYRQCMSVIAAVVVHVFAPLERTTPVKGMHAKADDTATKKVILQLCRAVLALERVYDTFLGPLLHPDLPEVLRYFDPQFSCCLNDVGLDSELYAIPFLTTLFADNLTLHDTICLWDVMLSTYPDGRFPAFMSAAVIMQVRGMVLGPQRSMAYNRLRASLPRELHDPTTTHPRFQLPRLGSEGGNAGGSGGGGGVYSSGGMSDVGRLSPFRPVASFSSLASAAAGVDTTTIIVVEPASDRVRAYSTSSSHSSAVRAPPPSTSVLPLQAPWFIRSLGVYGSSSFPVDSATGFMILSKLKEGGVDIDWLAAAKLALKMWAWAPETLGQHDAWPLSSQLAAAAAAAAAAPVSAGTGTAATAGASTTAIDGSAASGGSADSGFPGLDAFPHAAASQATAPQRRLGVFSLDASSAPFTAATGVPPGDAINGGGAGANAGSTSSAGGSAGASRTAARPSFGSFSTVISGALEDPDAEESVGGMLDAQGREVAPPRASKHRNFATSTSVTKSNLSKPALLPVAEYEVEGGGDGGSVTTATRSIAATGNQLSSASITIAGTTLFAATRSGFRLAHHVNIVRLLRQYLVRDLTLPLHSGLGWRDASPGVADLRAVVIPASLRTLLIGSGHAGWIAGARVLREAPPSTSVLRGSSMDAGRRSSGGGSLLKAPLLSNRSDGGGEGEGGGGFGSPRSHRESGLTKLSRRLAYADILPDATLSTVVDTLVASVEDTAHAFVFALRGSFSRGGAATTPDAHHTLYVQAVDAAVCAATATSLTSGVGYVILDVRDVSGGEHAAWAHSLTAALLSGVVDRAIQAAMAAAEAVLGSGDADVSQQQQQLNVVPGYGTGYGASSPLPATCLSQLAPSTVKYVRRVAVELLQDHFRIFHIPLATLLRADALPEPRRPVDKLPVLPSLLAALSNPTQLLSFSALTDTLPPSELESCVTPANWRTYVDAVAEQSIDRRMLTPPEHLASALPVGSRRAPPYSAAELIKNPGIASTHARPFVHTLKAAMPQIRDIEGVPVSLFARGIDPTRVIALRDLLVRAHLPFLSLLHHEPA